MLTSPTPSWDQMPTKDVSQWCVQDFENTVVTRGALMDFHHEAEVQKGVWYDMCTNFALIENLDSKL